MSDMDYLRAIDRAGISISVGGRQYHIRRASLKQFFLLQQSLTLPEDESIPRYLSAAFGIPYEDVTSWDAVEALEAYQTISRLNQPMSIHLDYVKGDVQQPKYEYSNRALASIVSRLASAYGWDRDYILDVLTYDEARCYLQELMLQEHQQREYAYTLSQIAYDAKGKRLPFPAPPIPPTMPQVIPFRPREGRPRPIVGVAGVIIDLNEPEARSG